MIRYVISIYYTDGSYRSEPLPSNTMLDEHCAKLSKKDKVEFVLVTCVQEHNAGIWRKGVRS